MKRDLNYTELTKQDFEKIASRLDLSLKTVEEVYNSYFETIKNFMALKTMPVISTYNFKIVPSKNKFSRNVRNLFKFGKKENLVEYIKKYWYVFDRIKNEKNNKATFLEWRRLEKLENKNSKDNLFEIVEKI